jgi:phosphate transport system substrate-binding protein
MDRRNFLTFSGGGLTALLLGRIPVSHGAVGEQLDAVMRIQSQVCRTRVASIEPLPQRQAGDLFYQGTHILTYGAFRELAKTYSQPGRRMVATGGGCDDGIGAVKHKQADLGGMCCPVWGSRAEGMPSLLVAHDYKAVVVHASNPIGAVRLEQLKMLARGKLDRWRELGGADRPVALVARKHCHDYFEPVRRLLLDNQPLWSERGIYVDTDEQITDTVSRYPAALGVVSWVFAQPLVQAGKLKLLAIDGHWPGDGKRYPLLGPLSVVYRQWHAPSMQPFFDFLYGPSGQRIMARALLPVSAAEAGYGAPSLA